jgi:hypothetical protein
MKPIKIVKQNREEHRELEKVRESVNMIKVYFMYVWIYRKETPLHT